MIRVKPYLAAISMSLLAALAACGGSDGAVDLAFARVGELNFAIWPAASYQARTAEAWQAIWAQRQTIASALSPMPVVDFGRDMVLGVSEGWGPSGCDSLRITRVTESATELVVDYVRSSPGPLVACTANLVPLVDFVTAPQSDKPVRFVRSTSS